MVDNVIPVKKSSTADWYMDAEGAGTEGDASRPIVTAKGPSGAALATAAKQDDLIAKFPDQSGGKVPVIGPLTDAELAARDPATAANQATGNVSLSTIAEAILTEDAAHASGAKGVLLLGVRNDDEQPLADDGDYHPLTVDNTGALQVNPRQLMSDIDEVAIGRVAKGAVSFAATLGLSAVAVTTDSAEIDMRYHNYLALCLTVSGAHNWTFKLQGSMISGGTFVDMYDGANLCSVQFQNGSRIIMWPCGSPYAKIVATEDEDGATATAEAVAFNR